jgi:hypothetical protein
MQNLPVRARMALCHSLVVPGIILTRLRAKMNTREPQAVGKNAYRYSDDPLARGSRVSVRECYCRMFGGADDGAFV